MENSAFVTPTKPPSHQASIRNPTPSSSLSSALDGQPGQYLLRHDERTGAFVEVRKAVGSGDEKGKSGGCLDLHSPYNAVIAGEDLPGRGGGPPWSREVLISQVYVISSRFWLAKFVTISSFGACHVHELKGHLMPPSSFVPISSAKT